jgi:DNA-binding transcriptional MerR regulator
MNGLTIGEVAKHANVMIDTIRYYERVGIMPAPPRSRSGYRQYMPADVQQLQFTRRAQRLGFTLREITQLLELVFEPEANCADVTDTLVAKVD